ncbi:MAG: hypothetical protein AAFO75_04150, partial [Pseudomonadota bacterium]
MSVKKQIVGRVLNHNRPFSAGLCLFLLAALAASAPFFIPSTPTTSVVTAAYVMATGSWEHKLTQPIVLSVSPRVTVRSGRILVPEEGRKAAASGAALMAKISDGSVPLLLDSALVEVELSAPKSVDGKIQDSVSIAEAIAPAVAALKSTKFSDLRLANTTVLVLGAKGLEDQATAIRLGGMEARLLRGNDSASAKGRFIFRNETVQFDIEASQPKTIDAVQAVP